MSRLFRILTVCLVNLFFIPIFEILNKQGRCPNLAVCLNIPDFTLMEVDDDPYKCQSSVGESVVTDSLFNVPPIVCLGSVFSPCFVMHAYLSVLSSFAIILTRKREIVALL